MNKNRKNLFFLSVLLLCSSSVFGSFGHFPKDKYKTVDEDIVNKWQVNFAVGSYELDSTFNGNLETLRDIKAKIQELKNNGDKYTVLGIKIRGYASPEGSIELNQILSERRAQSLQLYLMHVSGLPTDRFDTEGCGENWEELKEMIRNDHLKWGDKIIEIIESVPQGQDPEKALRKYKQGIYYRILLKQYFPKLRSASTVQLVRLTPVVKDTVVTKVEEPVKQDTVVPVAQEVVTPIAPVKNCGCEPPFMGINTNALYWAFLIPNIGVELYLGNRYSLLCDGTYKWKTFSAKHNRYNISTITGELRYWFTGGKTFTGWYLGAYGRYGEYDIKLGHTGRTGYVGGGGLSGGYVFSFHHVKCLFFELGASAGYDHLRYRRYYWYDPCNAFDGLIVRNRISLTRLNASFTWRF
jgi:hypothetical protein